MFKSIQLGNFKAFSDIQKVPFKPITLIFGANSAGKSSIIQSLAYMHHALSTGSFDVYHTLKGGDSIDLGGIEQLVHRHDLNNRVEWGFEIKNALLNQLDFNLDENDQPELWSNPQGIFDEQSNIHVSITIGIELDDQDRPKKEAKPKIYSYEINSDNKRFLKISSRPNNNYQLDFINTDNKLTERFINASRSNSQYEDSKDYKDLIDSLVSSDIQIDVETVLPKSVGNLSGISGLNSFQERFIKFISKLISFIHESLKKELQEYEYLGPLRSFPPRLVELAEDNDPNFKAGGGFAWQRVLEDSVVRKKVNRWLSSKEHLQTPYELNVRHLHTIDGLDKYYSENIYDILHKHFVEEEDYTGDIWSETEVALTDIKEFEEKISTRKELVLNDLRTKTDVSHRDIGIGISQVLPVLVSALGHQDKLVAIEQPEIHLHPALQAELGDVFIEGALKNDNRFILETHSEHLILRLLRRIRESTETIAWSPQSLTTDDVMILYVEPGDKGSRVIEIPVDDEGEFEKPWPHGFFAERSKELFG